MPYLRNLFEVSKSFTILSRIIEDRIDLGLPIDSSVYSDFEKKSKHSNFLFSSGIDLIYEFFKHDSQYKKNYSKNLFKFINKNKFFNNAINKFASEGFII